MRNTINKSTPWIIILSLFTIVGCTQKIERSGVVVDQLTNEPIEGVSIDIYLKDKSGDSLAVKVFTNSEGQFHIKEKRDEGQLFQLHKDGYIGHVNSLSVEKDTIELEKEEN